MSTAYQRRLEAAVDALAEKNEKLVRDNEKLIQALNDKDELLRQFQKRLEADFTRPAHADPYRTYGYIPGKIETKKYSQQSTQARPISRDPKAPDPFEDYN